MQTILLKFRRAHALLLAGALALPLHVWADLGAVPDAPTLPAHLTLPDALKLLQERGLDLLMAEAAVASAQADRTVAAAVPNPSLGVGGNRTFGYDPTLCAGCSALGWSLYLSDSAAIEDTLSGKRRARIAVADAALASARLTKDEALRNLTFQVKQQYIQAVQTRDNLDFALDVQKMAVQTLELTSVRYKAGAINEADLARIETMKLEADQAVTAAEQALRVGKAALAFLLGARGAVPNYLVDQDLPKFHVPEKLANADVAGLVKEALAHRPDLRAQEAQIRRAEESLGLAKKLVIPDVALQIGASGEGTGQNALQPPMLSVGVAVPLPVLYQYRGEVDRAQADIATQQLQVAKNQAQVVADVQAALSSYQGARALVERMETGGLLVRALRARDLVRLQYQKGASSLLEYLDAQRTYVATNVEYIQDLTNYWIAVFQLEQAVGMELQ